MTTEPTPTAPETIGERLVRQGRLSAGQVEQIVALQQSQHLRFGEAAVQLGLLTDTEVKQVLSDQFNYANVLSAQAADAIQLPIAHHPFGPEAEAIRQIRAGISEQLPPDTLSAIAILSPGNGEGKSYLAASLAISFAQAGKRTLLLNANLRNESALSKLLNAPPHAGLSSILANRAAATPGAAIPHFPLLRLLDAGPTPPNPTELLLEPRLSKLVELYRPHFDLILIDTPAFSLYSDAQIIARQADAALIVARQDHTSFDALAALKRQLHQTGSTVLGSVLNAAPARGSLLKRRKKHGS